MDRLLFLLVVLPRPGQAVIVDQLFRILEPGEEGATPLPIRALGELPLGHLRLCQATVLLGGRGPDALANAQVAKVAIGHPKHVAELRGRRRQSQRRRGFVGVQPRRGVQVAIKISPVVIDDVGIFRHKGTGFVLDKFDTRDDGGPQLFQLRVVFPGNVIDDAVNVALGIEIVGGHPDELGALLPR